MYKMILMAAAMTLSLSVYAEDWKETCGKVGSLAETIMAKRQEGVSMATMMKIVSEGEGSELAEALVIAAYDQPRYQSDDYIQSAINDFSDSIYLECAKKTRQ